MQRRQKSSTCSLWITQCPACTGWRCRMTAGVTFYIERIHFLSIDCLVKSICFSSSTLSLFSESEDESSRFLPKLPTLPKRWDSELPSFGLSSTGLNEKCLGRSFVFIFSNFLWPFSFALCFCSATAPHPRYLGKMIFYVLDMLFICLFLLCHTFFWLVICMC